MIELIQAAQDRRDALKKNLLDREAELEAMRAELEKLDKFVGLAKELFEDDAPKAEVQTQPAETRDEPEPLPRTPVTRTMPARPSKFA